MHGRARLAGALALVVAWLALVHRGQCKALRGEPAVRTRSMPPDAVHAGASHSVTVPYEAGESGALPLSWDGFDYTVSLSFAAGAADAGATLRVQDLNSTQLVRRHVHAQDQHVARWCSVC